MDRALFVICALLLNAALGGPRRWYEAVGIAGLFQMPASMLRSAERKLNREHRSLAERQWRGTVVTGAIVIVSLLVGLIVGWLCRSRLEFMELLILAVALPLRPTWDRVSQIRKSLYARDIVNARQALDGTAWRHHALLDEYGLARAAIEILAVNFSEKIIAPVFWYLLLGLPGLFASIAIALLQETLSQPGSNRFAPGFGQAAQLADYWLHFLPARIAAIFWLVAAACLPSGKWGEVAKPVLIGFFTETPQTLSLLSAASVLKLALGGPLSIYAGERWIGSGTPKPVAADVKRALNLFLLLLLVLFISLGLFL